MSSILELGGGIEAGEFSPVSTVTDYRDRPATPAETSELPRLSNHAALILGRRQAWHNTLSSLPLIASDLVAVGISVATAQAMASVLETTLHPTFGWGMVLMTLFLQHMHGLYPACGLTHSTEFRRLLKTSMIVCAGAALALSTGPDPATSILACWAAFSATLFVMLGFSRPIVRRALAGATWWTQAVVIFGSDEASGRLYHRLHCNRQEGLRPIGTVFDASAHWNHSSFAPKDRTSAARPNNLLSGTSEPRPLGPISDLESILLTSGACRLAIAEHGGTDWRDYHSFHGIPNVMLPIDLGNHPIEKMRLTPVEGGIELHCHTALTSPPALISKRLMDLTIVLLTMPVWLPLMLLIALTIKFLDPGPVFYRQSRVGRFRNPFQAIKFRSMVCDADRKLRDYLDNHPEAHSEWATTHKLQNDPRVTGIGEFLRKTSLDELPQLWNVLVGEMSLVGPRPIIDCSDYDREYIQEHPEVFELYQMVRPGITGLWQVSGRNRTSYVQRVNFDRFYLHNWSLTLDIYILWRTVKTALLREGAC